MNLEAPEDLGHTTIAFEGNNILCSLSVRVFYMNFVFALGLIQPNSFYLGQNPHYGTTITRDEQVLTYGVYNANENYTLAFRDTSPTW